MQYILHRTFAYQLTCTEYLADATVRRGLAVRSERRAVYVEQRVSNVMTHIPIRNTGILHHIHSFEGMGVLGGCT